MTVMMENNAQKKSKTPDRNLAAEGESDDKSYLKLPQVGGDEITLLWDEGYWDGRLSGKCLYLGKMHYFNCVDMGRVVFKKEDPGEEDDSNDEIDRERSDPWWRRFSLTPMTDDESMEALRRHELFRKHVGEHCDYSLEEVQKRAFGATKPQSEWPSYFNEKKKWPKEECELRQPEAWYEE